MSDFIVGKEEDRKSGSENDGGIGGMQLMQQQEVVFLTFF